MNQALKDYPPDMAWAIVQVKNQSYAVATEDLREMVIMPPVAAVPNSGEYVRGVINLRGRVLPLIDLRKRIGLTSTVEEISAFCTMLEQREEDHRKWLRELEAAVRERREFGLTTDPHKCAFGKWYDGYRAESQLVAVHLKKFDQPHRHIHGIAVEVGKLTHEGLHDRAQELIEATRSGALASMLELFTELRALVRDGSREIALVVEVKGKQFAVAVDSALSVEKLTGGSIEELHDGVGVRQGGVVRRFGKRVKAGDVILIIETEHLMQGDEIAQDPALESAGSQELKLA